MKINGRETKAVSFEVDERDILQATIGLVYKNSALNPGQWVDRGDVCQEEHTSHSWTDRIRKATAQDVKDYEVINYLEQLKRKIESGG